MQGQCIGVLGSLGKMHAKRIESESVSKHTNRQRWLDLVTMEREALERER